MLTIHPDVAARFIRQHTALFGPIALPSEIGPAVVEALRSECALRREAWEREPPPEVACWRDLFRAMGANSGTRASVDALFRRYLRAGDLPRIHPLVDLYNWVSLATFTPMAAYDAEATRPPFALRPAEAGEPFEPLGAPGVNEPPRAGEVVYADVAGVICRYWNWRDCHRTRVRSATREVFFMADITADTPNAALAVAGKIKELLSRGLGVSLPISLHSPDGNI